MTRSAPVLSLVAALALSGAASAAVVVVPPGNRSATQPEISSSSIARTQQTKGDFESKFRSVYDGLAKDPAIIAKIKATAARYGIDPIHMIGAIVGEHTYNVDIFDNLQSYYVKALAYLNTGGLSFSHKGERIETFVARPEFAECKALKIDYEIWNCRDKVWRAVFRGKNVGGVDFPDDRFERVFFQPFFAGQTFGLGQLSPIAALSVSDEVHARSGLPLLDMRNAPEVYAAVMDPDKSLNYMAAIIRNDIETYKSVANFDISGNPGLTATLYNTGAAAERAAALAEENRKRRAAGLGVTYPKENYYGWLINDRLADLKKLLGEEAPAPAPAPAPVPAP
jgi:hypothetical protein